MSSAKNKGSTPAKAKPVGKASTKPKPIAQSRFNYFVQCKHDLKHPASCPMCRLVNVVTRKHFEDEQDKLDRAHEQSLVNRAQLRLTLMLRWARCQSILYNKFAPTPTFDIIFSKALTALLVDEDAVNSRENPIDFDEIVKILNRRNRIQEVGHFAAVYLQSRIRKFLAKRYVRRMMLQRFEYVPATRRKDAFYVDNYWMRKWIRTPRYLRNEAPATPRTMSRRIAADDRMRELRFERYTKAMTRQYNDMDDVWAQEETTVRFLKQLGILRDVVRIAMLSLTRNRLRKAAAAAAAERLAESRRAAATPSNNVRGSTPQNARRRSAFAQAEETTSATAAAQQLGSLDLDLDAVDLPLQPVWICLSAPSCSARQLGLQLALATVPSPATGTIAVRTDGDKGPRCSAAVAIPTTGGMLKQGESNKEPLFGIPVQLSDSGKISAGTTKPVKLGSANGMGGSSSSVLAGSSAKSSATSRLPGVPGSGSPQRTHGKMAGRNSGSVTGVAQLHRSLQFLETSIWQCLRCNTPEEVLSRLMVEDIRPTLESVLNISHEPKRIWHGGIGYVPRDASNFADEEIPRQDENHPGATAGFDSALMNINLDDNSSVGSLSLSVEDGDGDGEDDYSRQVLPITLQLRPYYAERGCNGMFRLFFYMDELVAVSACSPWAFYPEVMKNRDIINNSLRAYAALPATKSFIQHFLTKANVHKIGESIANSDDVTPFGSSNQSQKGAGIASSTGSMRKTMRRPGMSGPSPPPGARKKHSIVIPPSINTTPSLPIQQMDLDSLFIPPEELIYGNTAPDRAALNRLRDIAQFSDEKTVNMVRKYSFMRRNPAFADRLRRAELNIANRLKRRGAATAAPTKAFTDASPYHQNLVKLEQWRTADPYLPMKLLNQNPAGDENNIQLVKDLSGIKSDLIGKKLLSLLRGLEEGNQDDTLHEETVNVFDNNSRARTGSTSATASHAESALVRIRSQSDDSASVAIPEFEKESDFTPPLALTDREEDAEDEERKGDQDKRESVHTSAEASVVEEDQSVVSSTVVSSVVAEERLLSEYESKLHRYSSKIRMEITERLRQPDDVEKVKELFPLVVMDVYVHLPGKAGITPAGSVSSNLTAMSSSPSTVRRIPTNSSAISDFAGSVGGVGSVPSTPGGAGVGGGSFNGSGASLLAVDLQQIVGAFSCETDRPPPNLDCGLIEWEHFYELHQQRVNMLQNKPRTPSTPVGVGSGLLDALSVSSGQDGGSRAGSSSSSKGINSRGGWTPTNNDTGVSTYLIHLPGSGIQYQCHILAAAPSKQYLERTLPKKVKEWLGLAV